MPSTWKKMAAYLGLVEEYDDEYTDPADEPQPAPRQRPAPPPEPPRSEPSNVRRIAPARTEASAAPAGSGPSSSVRPVPSAKVHVTDPVTFNDVEEVGDRFRNGIPVIMNLQR